MNDQIGSTPEFRAAHERATMWAKLGHTDSILTDSKIPEVLRERIYRFVTGADIEPAFAHFPQTKTGLKTTMIIPTSTIISRFSI